MYALVGREAKSKLAFSVRGFGVLAEEAAGQDRGDFGGALVGRHAGGRGKFEGIHGRLREITTVR